MRRLLATMPNCAPALLALFVIPLAPDAALSDPLGSGTAAPATPAALACTSNDVVVYEPNPSPGSEPACAAPARTTAEVAEARAYVIETASPGFTMTLQGAELAIGRLHPEFVVRLANAIREARNAGLPSAGVFSAYRPPAFGVGGFSDKFNSLHTYGLAVDMQGIGRPGSSEAQLLARDRRPERRRVSIRAARPGRVESLPTDEPQDHSGGEPAARDRARRRPVRPRKHVRGRQHHHRGHGERGRVAVQSRAHAGACTGSRRHRSRADAASDGKPRHEAPRHGAPRVGTQRRQTRAAREGQRRHRRRRADHRGRGRATNVIRPASEARHPHHHRPDKDHRGRKKGTDASAAKMSSAAKKAKPDTRVGARGAPVIAVEESRRKSKSGRG